MRGVLFIISFLCIFAGFIFSIETSDALTLAWSAAGTAVALLTFFYTSSHQVRTRDEHYAFGAATLLTAICTWLAFYLRENHGVWSGICAALAVLGFLYRLIVLIDDCEATPGHRPADSI